MATAWRFGRTTRLVDVSKGTWNGQFHLHLSQQKLYTMFIWNLGSPLQWKCRNNKCYALDFSPFSDADWDFYWCEVSWIVANFDQCYFEEHVKLCHFRNHYEVGQYLE